MRRREFLGILGGAAAWPVALKAQQTEPVRRVGVLLQLDPDDPEAQARTAVFAQTLQELGWAVGRNLVIDSSTGRGRHRPPSPQYRGTSRARTGCDP